MALTQKHSSPSTGTHLHLAVRVAGVGGVPLDFTFAATQFAREPEGLGGELELREGVRPFRLGLEGASASTGVTRLALQGRSHIRVAPTARVARGSRCLGGRITGGVRCRTVLQGGAVLWGHRGHCVEVRLLDDAHTHPHHGPPVELLVRSIG